MTHSAVVLHSGGLDSTVLMYYAKTLGYDPYPLSIYYGQRHARELEHAKKIAETLKVPHKEVRLPLQELFSDSVLTDHSREVPEGLYDEKNMAQTVVPNRNMTLLSVAGGYAVTLRAIAVLTAVHAGDHAVYPDCRPEFINAASQALMLATEGHILVRAPFVRKSKADIVSLGAALEVPMHLTWSCYKGGEVHCGVCGTCTERIEAFILAGVTDPTNYEPGNYAKAVEMLKEAGKIPWDPS